MPWLIANAVVAMRRRVLTSTNYTPYHIILGLTGPCSLTPSVSDRPMAIRTDASRYFSLRRMLIQIHLDLFKVERRIRYDSWPEPLTDFEILVLILEDRRFFEHHGIDFRSLEREIFRAFTLRRFGGASTIDMQFVRTATNYRQPTLRRKLYEMLLAWIIQYRYNKFEILRSYLACAFYGSHLIGIDTAAARVFGVSPYELSFADSRVEGEGPPPSGLREKVVSQA